MRQLMKFMALAILFVIPAFMMAQEVASVTGTVTDTTGAVVQGVKVTLLNTRTNTKYEATTNEMGLYTISKVLPGPGYKLSFERDGFEKLAVNDLYLIVGATRTQNAQLKVGAIAETMEVSAVTEGIALNTTDATVGSNFNMTSVSNLPVAIRDSPAALLQLQPGVVNGTGASHSTGSRTGSVTGARGDQNNITLDGLDVNDFATGQAFATVANAPVDSIQEFRGETAGSLSASGRGSGAQVQMVTKSGTNQFHGSVYEYHRNTATAANSWFNNLGGIKKPALLRNFFGASIGGPVKKDKLFFFFNYQGRRDARSVSTYNIVPLDSFRNGLVSYIKATDANGNTCSSAGSTITRQNTNPGCVGQVNAAQIAALDPKGVGVNNALLQFFNDRYPHANDFTLGDGLNSGGYRFTTPLSRVSNDYVTRIDYNLNNSMKLFGRFSILRDSYGDSGNVPAPVVFPGDPLTKTIDNKSYAYVIGHTWTISPTMVNQFTYGKTVSDLSFPTNWAPAGINYYGIGGTNSTSLFTAPYYSPTTQARVYPIPIFRDDLTWQKGNHNIQIGGTFKPIKTKSGRLRDINTTVLGIGGNLLGLNATVRPTDIKATSSNATNFYDSAFALMLGRYGSVTSNYTYDSSLSALPQGTGATRQYRYWETEAYIQDTWKATQDLTLTYGVRYQYYSVPYEVNGIQASQNLSFNEILAARVQAGAAGISGDDVIPFAVYDLSGKANGERGLYEPNLTDFAPRFSFAYSPKADGWLNRILGEKKTVFRGGAGIVYDHTVVNAANFQQDGKSYMFNAQATNSYGAGGVTNALLNDPRFTSINSLPPLPAAPVVARPYTPFVDSGAGFGLADGMFNYTIDTNVKTPYAMVFNFGIQRELPKHFVLEATYVGRLGRRLVAYADAAQLIDFKDPASGQMMSAAFAQLTAYSNNTANYNASGSTYLGPTVPWFENQIGAGGTALVAGGIKNLVQIGDVADTVQTLAAYGYLAPNVGMPSQFAGNTFLTNKGSSNYHGLLMSLHKNMSNGLQFDLNYTFSHSIDNASAIANSDPSYDGMGYLCDATNLRVCRANSDFDITHMINGNFVYELPFGKGKTFGSSANGFLDKVIGGWSISGIPTWRTGIAFSPATGAFLMGFANNSPAIFNGDRSAIAVNVHPVANPNNPNLPPTMYMFADPDAAEKAFSNPTGFQVGNRNVLRGPRYFNLDLGVAKSIPINERFKLQFRADSFNSLNHPSFGLPGGGGTSTNADINQGYFGRITTTASSARELQFALRLEF